MGSSNCAESTCKSGEGSQHLGTSCGVGADEAGSGGDNRSHIPMSRHHIDAFWSKVDVKKSAKECWEWKGARKPKGYGNVKINKKFLSAHRVAFEICHGPIPPGFIVCHVCDNPSCCNPSHLMLGTIKSNAADMVIKGRQKGKQYAARGSVNGNSKLSEAQVVAIRDLYSRKEMNQYELAEAYGVSQAAIGSIINRRTWRHIQ